MRDGRRLGLGEIATLAQGLKFLALSLLCKRPKTTKCRIGHGKHESTRGGGAAAAVCGHTDGVASGDPRFRLRDGNQSRALTGLYVRLCIHITVALIRFQAL